MSAVVDRFDRQSVRRLQRHNRRRVRFERFQRQSVRLDRFNGRTVRFQRFDVLVVFVMVVVVLVRQAWRDRNRFCRIEIETNRKRNQLEQEMRARVIAK